MAPDHQSASGHIVLSPMLGEIKDAVRALRARMPDSVLIDLAEQKIAMIERRHRPDEHRREPGRQAG